MPPADSSLVGTGDLQETPAQRGCPEFLCPSRSAVVHEDGWEQSQLAQQQTKAPDPISERTTDWVHVRRRGLRVGRFVRSTGPNKFREVGGFASIGCGEEL